MSFQVKELLLADGNCPFAEWFGSLDAVAAAKVRVRAVELWDDYKRRKASTRQGK